MSKLENSLNIIEEINISFYKSLLSMTPLFGTVLNEIFFDCRARVKQNRLNNFIETLDKRLKEIGIKTEDIKDNEDFIDAFELVIKKVVDTKAKYKINIFRDILINQLDTNKQIDTGLLDRFLDIIYQMSEIEIKILNDIKQLTENISQTKNKFNLSDEKYNFYIQNLISQSLLYDSGMNSVGARPFDVVKLTILGKELLDYILTNNDK